MITITFYRYKERELEKMDRRRSRRGVRESSVGGSF